MEINTENSIKIYNNVDSCRKMTKISENIEKEKGRETERYRETGTGRLKILSEKGRQGRERERDR